MAATPHPPTPSPSRGEGEQQSSTRPRTGRGTGGEGSLTPAVLLIGTLDTKGAEIAFVRDCLRQDHGVPVIVLDSGILGEPLGIVPDIGHDAVAAAAGEGETLDSIRDAGTRGAAVGCMRRGVARIALDLYRQGGGG